MENKKFEDCPFCGSDEIDTWDKLSGAGKTVFYAFCCSCLCAGPTADSEAEAIDAWNRRAGRKQ